ncbi:MAG: glycosyltransferase family 39 protein [Candidatus Omnitrophica bacterium]|nr:glycosyltransferase family 39 protein [Candidatus Omnitrophota bacterium]MCG2703625.1 glycosyltransferase family 39 protein [Candidatus Omnitrophota bacterium]
MKVGNFLKKITIEKKIFFFILIFFPILVFGVTDTNNIFENDYDEGVNLMRAYMVNEGFSLYKEIWMCQPPVLVLTLSCLFKFLGPSALVARLLVLAFSLLIVVTLFEIINSTLDLPAALCGIILLILSSFFVKMSVSVMELIPAVGFIMLTIYCLIRYEKEFNRNYIVFSGIFFAMAVLTRIFSLLFLPAVIIGVALLKKKKGPTTNNPDYCSNLFLWLIIFLVFLFLMSYITAVDPGQIFYTHILARKQGFYGKENIFIWLLEEWDIIMLAVGIQFLPRAKRRFLIMPLIAFLVPSLIFYFYTPRWYHHRVWVIIPLCWLAAFGFYALFRLRSKPGNKKRLVQVFFIIVLVSTIVRIPFKFVRMKSPQSSRINHQKDALAFEIIRKYVSPGSSILTDRPIVPFYLNLPVHPNFATVTRKRMFTGLLTAEDFIRIIQKQKPDLIFFARFPELAEKLTPFIIQNGYESKSEKALNPSRLFVLKK